LPGNSTPGEAVKFLSLDEVLALHERVIEKFGGTPGIRDPGLLESALFRPRSGYYEGLEAMAAALFESLLINHPFVDGNKRVAFFGMDVFLRLNGWKMQVNAREAHEFLDNGFAKGTCDFDHLLPWIRQHIVKLS